MLVLGVDLGGTGARAVLAEDDRIVGQAHLEGVADRVRAVEDLINRLAPSTLDFVAVGSTGFVLRGKELREKVPPLAARYGAREVLLCSDMVSGYVGALGLTSGVVIAAGTGAVALGCDLRGTWKRVDGWGYLLGDHGSGSWIGQAALQAALRFADGREGGSAALLALLHEHFGDPADLVFDLAQRDDRPAMMAGFVPLVEQADDDVARSILDSAGRQLAHTAQAAIVGQRVIATTGNLFQVVRVRAAFESELADDIDLRQPVGTAVTGTLQLARAAMAGTLPINTPCERFTVDG